MKNDWISKIKEARNLKNLTLESCSKEINIPVEFLSNLETANFKKLPPPVFTKFHINNWKGARNSLNASTHIRF